MKVETIAYVENNMIVPLQFVEISDPIDGIWQLFRWEDFDGYYAIRGAKGLFRIKAEFGRTSPDLYEGAAPRANPTGGSLSLETLSFELEPVDNKTLLSLRGKL